MSEPQRGTLADAIKSLKRVSRRLMAKQNTSGRSDTTTSMCLGWPTSKSWGTTSHMWRQCRQTSGTQIPMEHPRFMLSTVS
jgi:hypothetical protein